MPNIEGDSIDEFFEEDEFAVQALYSTAELAATHPDHAVSLTVIFDAPFAEALDIEGAAPSITLPLKNLPGEDHHDAVLTINSITYRVVSVAPDGQGMVSLALEEQDNA